MGILENIEEAKRLIVHMHEHQPKIVCTVARYPGLKAYLESKPDLDGSYQLIASEILEDDNEIIYIPGGHTVTGAQPFAVKWDDLEPVA